MRDARTPAYASALGRPIDPRFPSNRLVMAGSVAAGIGIALFGLLVAEPLPSSAFAAGMAVFLAWAIGRELDPDYNASAAVAMVAAFGYSIFAAPSLLLAAGMLIATRLIVGTVGIRIKPIDRLVLLGLGGFLGSAVVSMAAIPALMAGIVINEQRSRVSLILALATGSAGALVFAIRQPEVAWAGPGALSLAAAAVVILSLLYISPATQLAASPDLGSGSLESWRISAARWGRGCHLGCRVRIRRQHRH